MGKLLFICLLSYGHVNVCVSISKKIFDKYGNKHEIYFAVDEEYKIKLDKLCPTIKSIIYENPMNNLLNDPDLKGNFLDKCIQKYGKNWNSENNEKFTENQAEVLSLMADLLFELYPIATDIIKKIKPDFIITDQLFSSPIGNDQGIPYCLLLSAAISYFGHHQLPPPQSDLPSEYIPENVNLWEKFINNTYRTGELKKLHERLNNWLKSCNCPNLDNKYFYYVESPYLNIYNYPDELDYITDKIKLPGKWVKMNTAVVKPYPKPFVIPEQLKNLPGKLIYFSIGSMASAYKPLMNRLLKILSQISHRFIASLGNIGDEFKLSKNIKGEKFLDQLSVLQSVDLMITHGGNNTLTECFNFGVPLIVLPLFSDQINNSVRVTEKGYGCKLDPFKCTLEELNKAINFCLKEELQEKMKKISQRIQNDNSLDNVCEEIIKFL